MVAQASPLAPKAKNFYSWRPVTDLQPTGGQGDDPLRDQLLDAAARVFARQGYAGTKIQDIVREAGLSTGAVYGRFRVEERPAPRGGRRAARPRRPRSAPTATAASPTSSTRLAGARPRAADRRRGGAARGVRHRPPRARGRRAPSPRRQAALARRGRSRSSTPPSPTAPSPPTSTPKPSSTSSAPCTSACCCSAAPAARRPTPTAWDDLITRIVASFGDPRPRNRPRRRRMTHHRRSRRCPSSAEVDATIKLITDNAQRVFLLELRPRAATSSSRSTTRRWRRSGTRSPTSTGRPTSTPSSWSRTSPQQNVHRRARPRRRRGRTARRSQRGARRSSPQLGIESLKAQLQPVHARRAGGDDGRGQDRRDRAVDRRQVLRRHADDGRGPPHRGVRQVPAHASSARRTR